MRLLQRARPDRYGPVTEMPALPAERLRLGPGFEDQLHPLVGAFAQLLRVEVVGQRLIGRAAQQADDQPPAGHGVEHGQFLGQPHRIAVRHDRAEQSEFYLVHARRQISGGHRRRRGQDARRIMVLGQADPIEAELLDEADPLDHAAIDVGAGGLIIGAGGHRPNRRHRLPATDSGRFRNRRLSWPRPRRR